MSSVSTDVLRQWFALTLFITSLLSVVSHSKNVDIKDNLRKTSWFMSEVTF